MSSHQGSAFYDYFLGFWRDFRVSFSRGPGLLLSTRRRGGLRPRGCCRGREAVRKPRSAGPVLETGRAGPRSRRGDSRTFVTATSPPAPRARTPRAPCAERGRGGLLCPGRPERRIPRAAGTTRPGAAGRGQGSPGAPVCAVSPPPGDPEDDCNPPGSSVHGIFHARILEGTAISSSSGSSLVKHLPRVLPACLLCLALAGRVFNS